MADPDQPALLAGDADRECSVIVLRDAVVDGRLTLEEFSERVERAQLIRTRQELQRLVADLPAAAAGVSAAPAPATAEPVRHRAVCSRLVRSGPWELPAHASFRCWCGTIDLDLRAARLHGDEVVLDVHNTFGTVSVIVPPGIAVSVEGGGLFASEVVESGTVPPPPDAPRLRIRVRGMGGTLYVRPREPQSRLAGVLGAIRGEPGR